MSQTGTKLSALRFIPCSMTWGENIAESKTLDNFNKNEVLEVFSVGKSI